MASNPTPTPTLTPQETTRMLYKHWRERSIVPLLIGILVLGGLALVPAVFSANNNLITFLFIAVYVSIAIVTFIRFPYPVRAWVFLVGVYAIGLVELFRYGILGDSGIFFLAAIVLATMLLSLRAGVIMAALGSGTYVAMGTLATYNLFSAITPTASSSFLDWASAALALLMLSGAVIFGFQQLEKEFFDAQVRVETTLSQLQEERSNLESRVRERTIRLRRVNEIGRAITSILDPDELLRRSAALIGDEFECYYTAVFLVDVSGQWADLREATGDAGKVLRENKYRVDLRSKTSAISQAIRTRQIRIALDTGDTPVRFDNPLLPYTRSQICIPLTVGERVIGALEMHSTAPSAFQQQDTDTYQNMANEIAVALENARLFREAQQSLAEMRATQRQYLQGAWSSLEAEQRLEYSLGDREAPGQQVEVPLALRDEIIGQIQLATHEELQPEQKNLIEAIATQAALALENARLVEESQSIAARERLANEITSKVWASTTIDSILQTTVRELGRALEASEVEIQISVENENE